MDWPDGCGRKELGTTALMVDKTRRLIRVWFLLGLRSAQVQLLTRWGSFLFLLGKIVRFLLFFVFLFKVFHSLFKLINKFLLVEERNK